LREISETLTQFEPVAELFFFGTEALFKSFSFPKHIRCVTVTEVITHEDDPLTSLRRKKDSSICVGMRMLQKQELDAFVSSGNTGALLASATLFLRLIPSIERPALLTLLPTKHKEIAVLDVGANVSAKTEHLIQFAIMGSAYQKTRGIKRPTVGLLNIGVEAKKGTPELREAYKRLQTLFNEEGSSQFLGNIEGRDVFKGDVDVLVTDGFTGNVFLKTAEGIAAFMLEELQQNGLNDLSDLKKRLHYAEYPGALLCGVEGIVVKCHGELNLQSLQSSLNSILRLIDHSFLPHLKNHLSSIRN
jgi:glycerol-3-phosphate acyltransferase PlsX